MYFFSGEDDFLVPISSPRKMVRSLQAAGVTAEMYAVKNSGHLQALFDRGAIDRALLFADHCLKNKGRRILAGAGGASESSSTDDDGSSNGARYGK